MVVFLASFFVYIFTVSPTIFWRDTPEFQDLIQTLGISHPAGSPTYVELGKVFSLLPLGNLYLRGNLVSAFFASLATYMLYRILLELDTGKILSIFLSLFFAFSYPLWHNATVAEVYTMNSFFFLLLLYIVIRFTRTREKKYILLGSFIYGLSSGVHATVALFLPALAFAYFYYTPAKLRWRLIPAVTALFFLGFSTYVFLPLRAHQWPQFNWGNPQTLTGMIYQLTDAKDKGDRVGILSASTAELIKYIKIFIKNINIDFSPVVPLLSLAGFYFLAVENLPLFSFFILLAIFNILFFISWKIGTPLLPSHAIFVIAAGYGSKRIIETFEEHGKRIVAIAIVLGLFTEALLSFPRTNKYNYWVARSFYLPDFIYTPKNSVMISDASWFVMRDLQDIERTRDDLEIFSPGMIFMRDFFSPIDKKRFPEIADYSVYIDDYRTMTEFVKKYSGRLPVYIEISDAVHPVLLSCCPLLPGEKCFQRYAKNINFATVVTEFTEYTKRVINYMEIDASNGLSLYPDESPFIGSTLDGIGVFLAKNGRPHLMIEILKILKKWYPQDFPEKTFNINLGIAYFIAGEYKKGEEYMKKALPDPNAFLNLGLLKYKEGKYTEAYRYFNRITIVSGMDASDSYYLLFMGKTLTKLGKFEEAKKYLLLAREKAVSQDVIIDSNRFLKCVEKKDSKCQEEK